VAGRQGQAGTRGATGRARTAGRLVGGRRDDGREQDEREIDALNLVVEQDWVDDGEPGDGVLR